MRSDNENSPGYVYSVGYADGLAGAAPDRALIRELPTLGSLYESGYRRGVEARYGQMGSVDNVRGNLRAGR